MSNIPLKKLEAVKRGLEEGKGLINLKKEQSIDENVRELNNALIRRFGTETVGNPLAIHRLKRQASQLVEQAKVELNKKQILEVIEEIKAGV